MLLLSCFNRKHQTQSINYSRVPHLEGMLCQSKEIIIKDNLFLI